MKDLYHELRISIDPKYVKKLTEVLQLDKKQSRKPKQTPCASSSSESDNSAAPAPPEAATYRSAVGVLLYVAHDRPDIQFSVRSLSCGMKEPTEKKFKELQHLALYMKGTADCVAVFKKTKKGQSVLSTSNLSSIQGGVPEEEEQRSMKVSTSWKCSLIPIGPATKEAGGVFPAHVCSWMEIIFSPTAERRSP